jgi:bleomycin hydrolase
MKIRGFIVVLLLTAAASASAQTGGLSQGDLAQLRASFRSDAQSRVLVNAVTAGSVKPLALNRDAVLSSNTYFSNRIATEGVTDQKSSGRCWLYAGLNIMRPVAMTSLGKKGFEFSQTYLFFYDKLEKANLFLESIIRTRERPVDDRDVDWLLKNPWPDGGQWNMVLALIEKYGVVPSDVMPETESSGNTGLMNGLVSTLLRKDAAEIRSMHEQGRPEADIRARKNGMLAEVYRILAIHLGVPPERFSWRYEKKDGSLSDPVSYTPREFYTATVNLNLDDYVCLYSVPAHPFDRLYSIRYDRDLFDAPNMTFANVPFGTIRALTLASVRDNVPVWYGCDVGKESDSKLGVMRRGLYDYESVYGVSFAMSKKDRVLYQESVPSHAMVIVGVDLVAGAPEKWLVENSWGAKAGNNGLFAMYDSWFEEYAYAVIVKKSYLPKNVLALFSQTPEELPPWDPMFSMWNN